MEKDPADEAIIIALFKRFAEHRLPRAMELKTKVFAGEILSAADMTFLDTVFKDAQYVLPYSDKYPEHRELLLKALQLYTDITEQGLENERNQKNRPTK
ncbi:MAG: hypothetical protein JSS07_06205 [Proteobacteria bacterium]|nr:hypothetical protein [Pseudomonadota bacterium]